MIKTGLDRSSIKVRKSCIFVNGNLYSKINSDNEIQLVSGTSTEIQLVDKRSNIINSSTRDVLTNFSQSPYVESVTSTIPNPVVVEGLFTTSNQSINIAQIHPLPSHPSKTPL